MVKIYNLKNRFALALTCLVMAFSANAQVDVTASGGTLSATYTTLGAAFTEINNGTHTGVISIALTGSTTETGTAVLNASGAGSASYSGITISPSGGSAVTVTGSIAAGSPLIDLNGADNVIIDGLNTGGNSLTISNTGIGSTAGTSTIRFINDASGNTVANCTVLGATNATTATVAGTILFSNSTGTTGNDNNTISNNNIGDAGATPSTAITSSGQSATNTNDNISITGNNIYNYYLITGSNAINILANSSAWTISNNRFYQTTARTGLASANYLKSIFISTSAFGGYTINGNIIGYATSAGTGMFTNSGGRFTGIDINVAAAPVSNIQGNVISNINWTTASSASTGGAAAFNGIIVNAGGVNIGTTTGNLIGTSTGAGSATSGIYLTTTTSGSGIVGIYLTSATASSIQNNAIGGIATGGTAAMGYSLYGIYVSGSGSHTVSFNGVGNSTADNITIGISGTTTASTSFYGIYSGSTGSTVSIANNLVQKSDVFGSGSGSFYGIYNSSGSGTLNINDNAIQNCSSSESGTIAGIYNNITVTTLNITGNVIQNNTIAGTATFYGVYWNTATTFTLTANTVNNINRTGTGTSYGLFSASSSTNETVTNNIISNITATVASASTLYGIRQNTASGTKIFQNNQVFNLSGNSGTTIYGISIGYGTTIDISRNQIYNLNSTGGVIAGAVYGIQTGTAGTTFNVYKNKIYNLSMSSPSGVVYGIYNATSTINAYNNLIGDLSSTAFTSATSPYVGVSGIYINSGTANIYNNTVYIGAVTSSGANFTANGIYASTIATVLLQNNLVVNLATPTGSGKAVAYERSNTTLTTYSASSNNNSFYAGTPGANNLIFWDGTNAYQTLAAYKTAVAPRDQSSVSENPTFASLTGSSSTYLHIPAGTTTMLESGGVTVALFNTDYDGDARPGPAGSVNGGGTSYDIGADEFDGITPTPVITFTSATPALTPQCVKSDRVIVVNITTASGTITGAVLNYSYNGVAQTPVNMTNTSGSSWSGTILAPATGNAAVTWSVSATNSGGLITVYNGTSYSDEPTTGVTATASASPSTICSGASTVLSVSVTPTNVYTNTFETGISGFSTASVSGTPSLTQNSTYFSEGAQSMYFNTTSTSADVSASTNSNINLSNTSQATLTFSHIAAMEGPTTSYDYGYVQYSSDGGTTWISFPTSSYAGTGTLFNGVVSFSTKSYANWISAFTGTGSLPNNTLWKNETINIPLAALTSQFRVRFRYTTDGSTNYYGWLIDNINIAATPTPSAFSWSDGTSVVGTTNPLTVNPTSNTSYTATTTVSGCPVVSNAVAVTINPLPTAPTATNSSQCGTQIPLASVASAAGVNGTGTFNWYAASTGGVALQSGTSTTYQSTVASTTTFYVSETGTNGCESARTAVTVTVGSAPALTLSSSATSICIGSTSSTITLTSTIASFNSYSWAPATNVSGNENTGWTFNPNATTTYTLTANNSGTGCSNVVTLTVTVNPLPLITSVTTSVNPICEGSSTTLTGASVPSSPGTATIGAGTSLTGATAQPTAFCNRWPNYWSQTIFTAAELNAAGLVAGNITSMAYNISTSGDAAFNNNFTVKIGTTASTAFASTTFVSTASFTTVFGPATYTHTASGLQTITFSTPYVWDGVSNIIINVTHDGADLTNNSQTYYTATATNKTLWVNSYTGTTTTGTLSLNRLNVTFGGQIGTNLTSSLNWSWSPATGLSSTTGSTVTASPTTTTIYTVTATNASTTCSASQNITVNVNPKPLSPVNGNITQCGTSTPSPAVNYVTDANAFTSPTFNWYAASTGGSSLLSTTNTTLSPSLVVGANTFYVSVTNPTTGCESDRTTVTITVTAPPALTLSSSSISICAGQTSPVITATAGASSYNSFIWNPATSVAGNETAGWTFNPAATTSYTLTASNSGSGCINTATITVTVNPLPVISSVTASSGTICQGSSVTLTAASTFPIGGPAIIGTATTLTGTTAQPTAFCNRWPNYWSQTIYTAAELSAAGLVAGNITSMAYNISTLGDGATNPNFTVKIGTTAGVNFASTTFLATTSFTTVYGPATYTHTASGWQTITFSTPYAWDGVSNIVINVTHDGADALYNSQTYYTATPDNKTLWVNSYTGTTTTGAYSVNRLNIAFVENLTSSLNWLWSPAGSLNTATASTVTASPTSTTTYTVTATNSTTSCSSSQTVTVTVNPLPTVSVTSSDADNTVCSGTSVTLSGNGATTYVWTGGVSNGVAFTPPTGTNTYTVTGTDGNGCINTATSTVIVNPLPTVMAMSTANTVCAGTSVTLEGMGATSYSWTGGVNDGVAFIPTSTNTYTVTGTDANGCSNTATTTVTVNPLPTVTATSTAGIVCAGTSVTLTGTGTATSYSWTGGVSDGVAFTPASTNTYTVTGTDGNGCSNTATTTVTVNPLPTVTAMSTASVVCEGTFVTLEGMGATSYSWTGGVNDGVAFTPTATDTYTVTGTDANGCSNTATTTVTVNSLPTVTASSDATANTVCAGTMVTLTGSGTATSYAWDNGVTDGTPFTPTATTTYIVTGTDANSCSSTASITITVNSVTVDLGSDITQCGGSVTLDAMNAGDTYSWNDLSTNQTLVVSATGTYSVTVTDPSTTCSSTDVIDVTINTIPSASMTPFALPVCTSDVAFALTNGSPAGGVYSGTGVSSGMFDPSVSGNGMFVITYTITDGTTLCSGSDTASIMVSICEGIVTNEFNTITMYPNPASDMINISVGNANFSQLSISIVDIQGKEVFNETDKNITANYNKQINIEKFAKGVYYVKLNTGNDTKVQKLIVH
jgi:hypothetical protein